MLALVAFVMPTQWMADIHRGLGMGPFPESPILDYLARYASSFSVFYGAISLLSATDVHRYARLITLLAVFTLFASAGSAFFGWRAGMPAWWMVGDVISCWAFSIECVVASEANPSHRVSSFRRTSLTTHESLTITVPNAPATEVAGASLPI